jgi:sRNA-binding protein
MTIPPFHETSDLPACEQFATLLGRDEADLRCKVCGHLELEHVKPGRRVLSSDQIRMLREKVIDMSVAVEAARETTDQAFSESEPST